MPAHPSNIEMLEGCQMLEGWMPQMLEGCHLLECNVGRMMPSLYSPQKSTLSLRFLNDQSTRFQLVQVTVSVKGGCASLEKAF